MTEFLQILGDRGEIGVALTCRAAILLSLALVATRLLRRSTASTRHLIWSAAIFGVLLLPALSAIAPFALALPTDLVKPPISVPTELKPQMHQRSETPMMASAESDNSENGSLPILVAINDAAAKRDFELQELPPVAVNHRQPNMNWRSVVAAVWFIGALVFCLPLIFGWMSVRSLGRRSRPLSGEVAGQLAELARAMLGDRPVTGLQANTKLMPMTWGIVSPVILLPSDVAEWSIQRRKLVMLHELAHIRRYDCLIQISAQLVRAIYWFNPLAWIALSQLHLEQEQASDDWVLNTGAHADVYAIELLSITTRLPQAIWDSAVALAMGRAARLERRLTSILDADRNRRPLSWQRAAFYLVLCGGFALAISGTQRHEIMAAARVAPEGVAVMNGDFEGPVLESVDPIGWTASRFTETPEHVMFAREANGHHGSRCVSLTVAEGHDDSETFYSWSTELTGWQTGGNYRLSAWFKTENTRIAPIILVQCRGLHDEILDFASTQDRYPLLGTREWTRVATSFVIPTGTARIVVQAGSRFPGQSRAKIWLDDIAVEEIKDEPVTPTTIAFNNLAVEEEAKKPAKTANLNAVIEQIQKHSVAAVDQTQLSDAAIRGMLESLKDPYSTVITAQEMKELHQQLEGRMAGIGAALAKSDQGIVVQLVMPNSPAMKGALKPRDEILAVNGQPATNLTETVAAIRGPVGTEVTLKIRRAQQEEISLTLKRGEIRLSGVKGLSISDKGEWQHWFDSANKIGYVSVIEFNAATVSDLKATLKSLAEQGLKGLILDLRGNPGGQLTAAIDTAQLFLKDALVVQTRGRDNDSASFKTGPDVSFPDLPLIVTIDGRTASAAEVLTSALKDHGRAIVVGERSFGKGSVQAIYPLDHDGPAIKLTTAQMLSPNGQSLHRQLDSKTWGVDPQDGFYVQTTPEQRMARYTKMLSREQGTAQLPPSLTPEVLEKEFSDPVLSAALLAMQSKLDKGEFSKTGKPLAEQQVQLDLRAELRKQRDELHRKLRELNQALGEDVASSNK